MGTLRRFVLRLANALRLGRPDADLAREVASHLQLLEDEFERRGMTPAAARAAAYRTFGSTALAKDLHRDARSFVWVEDIRRDAGFAIRMLRRTPGFTVVAVLTLGMAIGVNTVVFTVTTAVLFKGFPLVERNEQLVYVTSGKSCCVSYPDYEDWRAQASSFSGMALVHGIGATVNVPAGDSELVAATEATANTFRVAGQRPLLGRDFTPADEQPGSTPVAILRYSAWRRWFGGDPHALGHTLRVNGRTTTVIGVMPRGFSFPQNQDLWLPLVPTTDVRRRDERGNWFALGRLRDGVTLEQARAEMTAIGRRLGAAYPATNQGRNLVPIVSTFEDFFIGASAGAVYRAMWGAVAFVLLIACANLTNLLLARGLVRTREIAVRMAIGAGRWRVVRQLLIESLVLSAVGGVIGWWIARAGITIYSVTANGSGVSDETFGLWFMNVLDYSLDYRAFAYLTAISIGTGVLVGLAPALRLSTLDMTGRLTPTARGATSDLRTRRASWMLVAAEMALAIVLIAGAGMLVRSFVEMYTAGLGFDPSPLLTTQITLPRPRYATPEAQRLFVDRLSEHVRTIPGVDRVATASALPGWNLTPRAFEIDGSPATDEQHRPTTGMLKVGGDYFGALGVHVVAGRDFQPADNETGQRIVIVNEQFASRYLRGQAIGQRIRLIPRRPDDTTQGSWMTIIGVAPDIMQSRDLHTREPVIYVPVRQEPFGDVWVLARQRPGGEHLESSLKAVVRGIDPDLPLGWGPSAFSARLANNYQFREVVAAVFSIFAAIALLLASLGLYAVMAHIVVDRTREIGIRAVMGGTVRDILHLVLSQALKPIGAGLIGGIAASAVLGRVLRAEFAQITPSNPVMLAAASAILVAAALIGCVVPIRRALRVDPVAALRGAE